jgi:hypothetical protein
MGKTKRKASPRLNCTQRLNSKFTQRFFAEKWKAHYAYMMQTHGGLPDHCFQNFKKGFHKGFMDSCKARRFREKQGLKRIN